MRPSSFLGTNSGSFYSLPPLLPWASGHIQGGHVTTHRWSRALPHPAVGEWKPPRDNKKAQSTLQGTSWPDSLLHGHSERSAGPLPPEGLLLVRKTPGSVNNRAFWSMGGAPKSILPSEPMRKYIQDDMQGTGRPPPEMPSLSLQDSDAPEHYYPIRSDLSLLGVPHSAANAQMHWLGPQ